MRPLHVVTMISNPIRFSSRYRLYNNFAARIQKAGVSLTTVEVAFGERPFVITGEYGEKLVQLRTSSEIWHKENAINIGFSHLPDDWQYAAWVDADIRFLRDGWAEETVHQLQHYAVVQMFRHALDLGPNGDALGCPANGFVWSYMEGRPHGKGYAHWHPGYAWAIRREAFDALGGLIDWAILGAADHHMALALIGAIDSDPYTPSRDLSPRYLEMLRFWQDRAERHIKRNVGYVPGTIVHEWHGKKRDRRYADRWRVLTETQFDPDRDIKRDWQMLYQLTDASRELRVGCQRYFRARNEDSIDLE